MKKNNFFLLLCGVILCVGPFLILDASYPVAPESQDIAEQAYDQLPKWNYAHPIYALDSGAAGQADKEEADCK